MYGSSSVPGISHRRSGVVMKVVTSAISTIIENNAGPITPMSK